jgi:hypothetical protein
LDDNLQAIAKLVEGDQKKISKVKAHRDDRGNILADGKIGCRLELLPLHDKKVIC